MCEDADGLHVCLSACEPGFIHSPLYSPVMEILFHRGRHWENAVRGRDRAEDPYNVTHRMSENVTQSQELSSVSAGATLIM